MMLARATNSLMLERLQRAVSMSTQPARLSLRDFIRGAWPTLEPVTRYVHGWHIDAICEHLTAVTNGQIRNLLINIPPRHMKSLSVSVFWPMWAWTFKPETRWLFASYAETLAVRDSLKCRRLIQSPWFQGQWSHVFKMTGDQNVKGNFENDRTGYRFSTGVGGAETGAGGDVIVADDPHKTHEAESDTMRENVLVWWDETMSTRLNDPNTGVKIIIMQRVHEADLSGHVLEQGGYEHLCLPAEYEPKTYTTVIGWSDPRKDGGELLWPDRFGVTALSGLKRELGVYGSAGQLQQRPVPRGGGIFQYAQIEIIESVPVQAARVRYWDLAATEGGGAFTVGLLLVRDLDKRICVEDIRRGQLSIGQRDELILQTAHDDAMAYGNTVQIWIEQEPGSSGKETAEDKVAMLRGFPAHAEKVTGSKEVRAEPVARAAEAGELYVLSADWTEGFLNRLALFPMGRYKDEIDALSGAYNKLSLIQYLSPGTTAKAVGDAQTVSRFTRKTVSGSRWGRTDKRGWRR